MGIGHDVGDRYPLLVLSSGGLLQQRRGTDRFDSNSGRMRYVIDILVTKQPN